MPDISRTLWNTFDIHLLTVRKFLTDSVMFPVLLSLFSNIRLPVVSSHYHKSVYISASCLLYVMGNEENIGGIILQNQVADGEQVSISYLHVIYSYFLARTNTNRRRKVPDWTWKITCTTSRPWSHAPGNVSHTYRHPHRSSNIFSYMEKETLQIVSSIFHILFCIYFLLQLVTLIGMWIIPVYFCLTRGWYRFLLTWFIFTVVSALVWLRASAPHIGGTTPR